MGIDYLWPTKTVGQSVDFLVNPYKENSVGYHIPTQSYLKEEDLTNILPDLALDDPLWDDDEYWDREYKDYIIWDWLANSGKISLHYGYHAYDSLESLMNDSLYEEMGGCIIGVVSGYGKLHKHSKGFRSEYMNVLAISFEGEGQERPLMFVKEKIAWRINRSSTTQEVINQIGNNLNIPVVSLDEIYNMERQYASR
jgi:hypothetical protein